jgi:CDGSH-type Zn-finger protein/uncharacterized Fe-S cluster protein YjdI
MTTESVRGTHLTIHFDGARCIHSRQCVLGAPKVFQANVVGPWINPDGMPTEDLIAIAKQCPSGAIRYERHDGGDAEAIPEVNVARVREHGPYAFVGDLEVAGAPAIRATLCRCGQSKNKPYCDNSHVAAGFTATGELAAKDSQPLAVRGGKVVLNPAPNGPLLVTGNLEICSGTGHTIDRVEKCALCRCGQSATKPFCDGSHRAAGFVG